jgi:hypothetical protein
LGELVMLLSTRSDDGAIVKLGGRRVEIRDSSPEHVEGFEFEWVLDHSLSSMELKPIILRQTIGPNRYIIPLPMEATCAECDGDGIRARLHPGIRSARLRLEVVDPSKFARVPDGKRLDVEIAMTGRKGAIGRGKVGVTIRIPQSVPAIFDEYATSLPAASDSGRSRFRDADRASVEAIRALPWLEGRTVNIHAVEGDALAAIVASFQAADSADYHALDTLGNNIIDEPVPGFAAMAIQEARRFGANFQAFTNRLLSRLYIDCGISFEATRSTLDFALSIIERENMRPTRFYLVTSSDPNPKPMALLGTRRDHAGSTVVVPAEEATSMRTIFDGIEKKWFARLEQSLAGKSSTGDAGSDRLLRRVWPETE